MSTQLVIITLIFIAIISFGCSNKKITHESELNVVDMTDPFASAFRNKRIKYLLEEAAEGSYDTTAFDSIGNKCYVKGMWVSERYDYNRYRFITRFFSNQHVYANYVVDYAFAGDSIIQIWKELPHLKWRFEEADLDSTDDYSIVLILDRFKRIVQEKDTMRQQIISYFYSDSLLAKKESRSSVDNTLLTTEVYHYTDAHLNRLEIFSGGDLVFTYFYSEDGLPEFKRRSLKGFPSYDLKFKYVYY